MVLAPTIIILCLPHDLINPQHICESKIRVVSFCVVRPDMYPLETASKTSHTIDTVIKEISIALNLTRVLTEKTYDTKQAPWLFLSGL